MKIEVLPSDVLTNLRDVNSEFPARHKKEVPNLRNIIFAIFFFDCESSTESSSNDAYCFRRIFIMTIMAVSFILQHE